MATRIQKKTAQRMLDKLNGELNSLFEHQEMGKGGRMAQKCCRGGKLRKPKAQFGQLMTAMQGLSGMPQGWGQGLQTAATGLSAFNPGELGSNQFSTPQSGNTQGLFGLFNRPWAKTTGNIGRGLGNLLETGMSYAPAMYNLGQGMQPAEQINYADYRNPEYNKAASLMADRRYDPSSELEAVEESNAVYRQGLRNVGSQSSGTLHNRLSSAASRRLRGRSDVFNRAQNINLGLQGEEAQFRAGLGAQDAATRFNVDDVNARNRAAQRSFLGESMTNIQQIAMQNRLMRNQRQRDDRLFGLAQSMIPNYEYGDDYKLKYRGE